MVSRQVPSKTWGKTLQTVILFGALLLLAFVTVSATFRAKVRVLVAKNFFSYRYDYREEWLKFTRTLTAADAGWTEASAGTRSHGPRLS